MEEAAKQHAKKVWTPPVLESLDIGMTEYWEFRYNPNTGFWQNVWVNES